jgi:hypothetical protein
MQAARNAAAQQSDVLKLSGDGKVVTGRLGRFERIVLFIRGVHTKLTADFLKELRAKLKLKGDSGDSLVKDSLRMARGDARFKLNRGTPLMAWQVLRAEDIATRFAAQKEWHGVAARTMRFHSKAPNATWSMPDFADICNELGLPTDALDQPRSELYDALLVKYGRAYTGKEIPVNLEAADSVRRLRPIALNCLRYVAHLSDEQVKQAHEAWKRGEDAIERLLTLSTCADPAALATALRELQGAVRGVMSQADFYEGPDPDPQASSSSSQASEPAHQDAPLAKSPPLVRKSRRLVLTHAITSKGPAQASALYQAAMGPRGVGRALIFAAYISEKQLAHRKEQLRNKNLTLTLKEVPQEAAGAATDLRELAHDVLHSLGLQACLDPQEIEQDLAILEKEALDAAAKQLTAELPEEARTLDSDGYNLGGVERVRGQREQGKVANERLIAGLVGQLRAQSGIETELMGKASLSQESSQPPTPPDSPEFLPGPSTADEQAQAEQIRRRVKDSVKTLTIRSLSGDSAAPAALATALRELHLAVCANVPPAQPEPQVQYSPEALLRNSRTQIIADIVGSMTTEEASTLYREAMATEGAGRALIFTACINEKQLAGHKEHPGDRGLERAEAPPEVARAAKELRELAYELFMRLGIQAGVEPSTILRTLEDILAQGSSAGSTLVDRQPLPKDHSKESSQYRDGLSTKGIRLIREQQLAAGISGGGTIATLLGQLRLQSRIATGLQKQTPLHAHSLAQLADRSGHPPQTPTKEVSAADSTELGATTPRGSTIAPRSEGPPVFSTIEGGLRARDSIEKDLQALDSAAPSSSMPGLADPFLQALRHSQIAVQYAGQTFALTLDDFGRTPLLVRIPLTAPQGLLTREQVPLASPDPDLHDELADEVDTFELIPAAAPELPDASEPDSTPADQSSLDTMSDPLSYFSELFGKRELVERVSRIVHPGIVEPLIRRLSQNEPTVGEFMAGMGEAKPVIEFGAILSSDQGESVRVKVRGCVSPPRGPRRSLTPGPSASPPPGVVDPPRSSLAFTLTFRVLPQGGVNVLEDPTYHLTWIEPAPAAR